MQRGSITLDQKLKYLKEVHQIYALSKKTLPPKGKSWNDIADARLRKVLQMSVRENTAAPVNIQSGGMHHEHSPRSARLIERTLQSGLHDPRILNSYRHGVEGGKLHARKRFQPRPHMETPRADERHTQLFIQHSEDLHYPHGHLQGSGFIPRQHEVNSHIKLMPSVSDGMPDPVPTKGGLAAGSGYH